jgi:hypothetical protein
MKIKNRLSVQVAVLCKPKLAPVRQPKLLVDFLSFHSLAPFILGCENVVG